MGYLATQAKASMVRALEVADTDPRLAVVLLELAKTALQSVVVVEREEASCQTPAG